MAEKKRRARSKRKLGSKLKVKLGPTPEEISEFLSGEIAQGLAAGSIWGALRQLTGGGRSLGCPPTYGQKATHCNPCRTDLGDPCYWSVFSACTTTENTCVKMKFFHNGQEV